MARIAFIGLGNMGGPMSANLAASGHTVRGFDVVADKVAAAVERGITPAMSNSDAVAGADIVLTMLPTGVEVREVLMDVDNVLGLINEETIVIDSSTTDLVTTEYIHEQAASRKITFLDSPVSGGMSGAVEATLTFMAGGDTAAIEKIRPILLSMGKTVIRAGGPSAGQAVKVCNNMLLGISMVGACEAIALGEAAGVDHQVLFDVISNSTGNCWSMNVNCPMPGMVETSPANRNYDPGFTATLMLKDLTLSQEAAAKTGAVTQLGEHVRQLYERFCQEQDGERDFSAMIEMVREMRLI